MSEEVTSGLATCSISWLIRQTRITFLLFNVLSIRSILLMKRKQIGGCRGYGVDRHFSQYFSYIVAV